MADNKSVERSAAKIAAEAQKLAQQARALHEAANKPGAEAMHYLFLCEQTLTALGFHAAKAKRELIDARS